MPTETRALLHASAVAVDIDRNQQRAVLILGVSGRGKSTLALQLMGLGALLVADDRVEVQAVADELIARPPERLEGLIEARGIGILNAGFVATASVSLVVDLDRVATERLPQPRRVEICGISLPCVDGASNPGFPAAVLQYVKGGLAEI